MKTFDNGGANAIKGFNYQKSVIALIAVLNYQREGDFQIYVESEDDIVVTTKGETTYIQAKSGGLTLGKILKRDKGKASILEKNLANGNDSSRFKLVTPDFGKKEKYLDKADASVLTKGASVYSYTVDAVSQINTKLSLSKNKIENSRVALTAFKANQKDALTYVIGVMANEGMSVDNSCGKAALQELGNQIDQRSEIEVESNADYERKKFTHDNLATIFTHSLKLEMFNKIVEKLEYSVAKQADMQKRRVIVGAIYGSLHSSVMKKLGSLDLNSMSERDVISAVLATVDFGNVNDEMLREVIIVDAFSQFLFERNQL